jgi:hypothetical protein
VNKAEWDGRGATLVKVSRTSDFLGSVEQVEKAVRSAHAHALSCGCCDSEPQSDGLHRKHVVRRLDIEGQGVSESCFLQTCKGRIFPGLFLPLVAQTFFGLWPSSSLCLCHPGLFLGLPCPHSSVPLRPHFPSHKDTSHTSMGLTLTHLQIR